MLRRVKAAVEKGLAKKEETLVEVSMTLLQMKCYRAIYERNPDLIAYLAKGGGESKTTTSKTPNMMNMVMELRKCCNHPYLIRGVEESVLEGLKSEGKTMEEVGQELIKASGKLFLLDRLLSKLIDSGHKVLIFSQMVRLLDILEEYLNYKKYKYERIDGGVRGNDRQAAIDRFSAPGSDKFVFLLCTRAGGVGINLTAADTVIIYDSDWNPQNDIQAQARCHRIGQKKLVKVYRFVTKDSYEEQMLDTASRKLGVDTAVLSTGSLDDKEEGKQKRELDESQINLLLKKGVYVAFGDGGQQQDYTEEDIEKILDRTSAPEDPAQEESAGQRAGLGAFSGKASFRTTNESKGEVQVTDRDFWKKVSPWILGQGKDANLTDGPRTRRQTRSFASEGEGTAKRGKKRTREESEKGDGEKGDKGEEEDKDDDIEEEQEDEGEDYEMEEDDDEDDAYVEAAGTKKSGRADTWSTAEKNRVRTSLLSFSYGRWADIKKVAKITRKTNEEVERYAKGLVKVVYDKVADKPDEKEAIKQLVEASGENFSDFEKVEPEPSIIKDEKMMEYLGRNVAKVIRGLENAGNIAQLIKECGEDFESVRKQVGKILNGKRRIKSIGMPEWWTNKEDASLLLGCWKYGVGKYDEMRRDETLTFVTKVKPKEKTEAKGDQATNEWLSTKDLNNRVKKLSRAISVKRSEPSSSTSSSGRSSKGGDRGNNNDKDEDRASKRRKTSRHSVDWSKREREEIEAAFAAYGPRSNEDGEHLWGQILEKTNLSRDKTEAMVDEYYCSWLAKCTKTVKESKDKSKKQLSESEQVERERKIEKSMQIMKQILMFTNLRNKILRSYLSKKFGKVDVSTV
eukprot:TRINITY_DN209_c0_g4_i2.p1 TRINITY_DN209_c0_g4~~TRINITY_DN209_c0_g4_i2.p1  ORF type:complete len:852 (+),score=262.86 TRINITY_DN209_c0_g4_i2:174-2729(+)